MLARSLATAAALIVGVVGLATGAACQGGGPAESSDPDVAASAIDAGLAVRPPLGEPTSVKEVQLGPDEVAPTESTAPDEPTEPTGREPADATGAIPAWDAVVQRDQFLARRQQRGNIVGVVGGPVMTMTVPVGVDGGVPVATPRPGWRWLLDDSEGGGSLGIRVAFGATEVTAGARVAATGAWALDEQRRWYWQADHVEVVAATATVAAPRPGDPPPSPGHIAILGSRPPGTLPVSRMVDDAFISFQVLKVARWDGDGWTIANELGDPPVAMLLLPGERPSYGGHDLRQSDERWHLQRGVTYWVRIGKVRRKSPTVLPVLRAQTAPVRVP